MIKECTIRMHDPYDYRVFRVVEIGGRWTWALLGSLNEANIVSNYKDIFLPNPKQLGPTALTTD